MFKIIPKFSFAVQKNGIPAQAASAPPSGQSQALPEDLRDFLFGQLLVAAA